jgi:YbbR domain-containing protein
MKRFIKEFLLENWILKATAVLLALIVWMFVRGEPGIERVVAVPLEVQVPSHMEISNNQLPSVEVTMRGAAFSNMWLSQPLPTCIVDLQDATEGEHVITLTPDNVKTPKGSDIDVLQVSPVRIEIKLEQTISKEVPVFVPILGEPQRDFEIYGKTIKPAAVVVTGPRSQIESIREVTTEAVSINGQKESARFFVGINPKSSAVRISEASPVQVDIQGGRRRKLYTITKVQVAIDDADYAAAPAQVSVQVLAPSGMSEGLTPADFRATVAIEDLNMTKFPARVKPVVRLLRHSDSAVMIKAIQPAEIIVRRIHNQ